MISAGWAWLGPSDVLRSEEAVLSGKQRLEDARQALTGWLFFQGNREFQEGFVEAVKARTAADFGITNELGVDPSSMNLYDVRMTVCVHTVLVHHVHCVQAVTVFAKACDKLPLLQCQTNASAMLGEMRKISFVGKSGLIRLDNNEDRVLGSVAFNSYWVRASAFSLMLFSKVHF